MMSSRAFLFLYTAFLPLVRINAQTTEAVCDAGWEWASNSLSQSPCVVAAYARAVCVGNYDVVALKDGYWYIGPDDPKWSDPCYCSSITYSLLAACQVCQGELNTVRTWGQWTTNCSMQDTSVGVFPREIPVGTAFPAWAYQSVQSNDVWSSLKARDFKSTNDTEFMRPKPSASSPSSSSVAPTNSNKPVSGSSSTNIGAIVGGVVGGVGGLAILGAAIFFFLRRRKQRRTSPSQMYLEKAAVDETLPFATPSPGPHTVPMTTTRRDATGAPVYYNPSDPSTFPTTPSPYPPTTTAPSYGHSNSPPMFTPVRPEL